MSRVGYAPITVPNDVTVEVDGSTVTVKGSNGELTRTFHEDISIALEDGVIRVGRPTNQARHKELHGLTRALLNNMVTGVSSGFRRTLDLVGTGYRAQQNGNGLTLQLGYSHPVNVTPLEGVTVQAESQTRINVSGADKETVGQQAALIRGLRPPNSYTGKGVRYTDEQVRLKPGKSASR